MMQVDLIAAGHGSDRNNSWCKWIWLQQDMGLIELMSHAYGTSTKSMAPSLWDKHQQWIPKYVLLEEQMEFWSLEHSWRNDEEGQCKVLRTQRLVQTYISCQNYTSKSATPVWEVHAINHWQMTRQLQQFLDTVTFGRKERQTCTVTERLQQYRKTTQQKEPMTQQTTGENNN